MLHAPMIWPQALSLPSNIISSKISKSALLTIFYSNIYSSSNNVLSHTE